MYNIFSKTLPRTIIVLEVRNIPTSNNFEVGVTVEPLLTLLRNSDRFVIKVWRTSSEQELRRLI